MSRYSEFFLNSRTDVVQLELLEISHPAFSRTYRIVRNAVAGVTVTLEDSTDATFDYYPLQMTPVGNRDNLDSGIRVDLGDLGEILPTELDAVAAAGGFSTKPTIIYRCYRSDDLSAPLFPALMLEVETFSFTKDGASFEAKAPSVNVTKTGEAYSIARFPMLRGFLTS
jgi:hypothetical protein